MNIKKIFKDVNTDIEINNLEVDSRVQSENAMFFCIEGLTNDSHDFIPFFREIQRNEESTDQPHGRVIFVTFPILIG